jgi:hypothetical protein
MSVRFTKAELEAIHVALAVAIATPGGGDFPDDPDFTETLQRAQAKVAARLERMDRLGINGRRDEDG